MRIDKFLKVSRLIKRRTVANEVADAGRITVNGRPVTASYACLLYTSSACAARWRCAWAAAWLWWRASMR